MGGAQSRILKNAGKYGISVTFGLLPRYKDNNGVVRSLAERIGDGLLKWSDRRGERLVGQPERIAQWRRGLGCLRALWGENLERCKRGFPAIRRRPRATAVEGSKQRRWLVRPNAKWS